MSDAGGHCTSVAKGYALFEVDLYHSVVLVVDVLQHYKALLTWCYLNEVSAAVLQSTQRVDIE